MFWKRTQICNCCWWRNVPWKMRPFIWHGIRSKQSGGVRNKSYWCSNSALSLWRHGGFCRQGALSLPGYPRCNWPYTWYLSELCLIPHKKIRHLSALVVMYSSTYMFAQYVCDDNSYVVFVFSSKRVNWSSILNISLNIQHDSLSFHICNTNRGTAY